MGRHGSSSRGGEETPQRWEETCGWIVWVHVCGYSSISLTSSTFPPPYHPEARSKHKLYKIFVLLLLVSLSVIPPALLSSFQIWRCVCAWLIGMWNVSVVLSETSLLWSPGEVEHIACLVFVVNSIIPVLNSLLQHEVQQTCVFLETMEKKKAWVMLHIANQNQYTCEFGRLWVCVCVYVWACEKNSSVWFM